MFATLTDQSVTWGDLVLVLGILALIAFILTFLPRWRR